MKSGFGRKLKVTITGGSHEPSLRVTVSGLPTDFSPDLNRLQTFLNRRAPGRDPLTSSRQEPDIPELVFDSNHSTPPAIVRTLTFEIPNTDVRSSEYEQFQRVPRPGHADYTARLRYGETLNMAGGGPFSGRMTAPLCVAGGLAIQLLEKKGVSVSAQLSYDCYEDVETEEEFRLLLAALKEEGDSIGGIVECFASGLPAGIGNAMYEGLESMLSPVLFGIPAVKGVDFGAGFRSASMKGSEHNDAFFFEPPAIVRTRTNNCGGILGGISTGMPIVCRVFFKPTPSIGLPQESVNLTTGESAILSIKGRHDPCVALRAVPAVEAAVALVLLDSIMVTEEDRSLQDDSLELLRKEIDAVDDRILQLFQKRMNLSARIADCKRKQNLPIENLTREEEILNRISAEADSLYEKDVLAFFRNIFTLGKQFQRRRLANPAPFSDDVFGLV